ncbi:hypothetical protein ZIOFF_021617 [Zingiber officinale]|uniref:Serine aminopeptidase S33 domain-containing protein n=1 Tax=Zingiber officinale TaxID=94328 RepID=A0A8J5H447_ZINOF|nr:hypothetical protein ZIOFF_021617 [Zingiber officinale]
MVALHAARGGGGGGGKVKAREGEKDGAGSAGGTDLWREWENHPGHPEDTAVGADSGFPSPRAHLPPLHHPLVPPPHPEPEPALLEGDRDICRFPGSPATEERRREVVGLRRGRGREAAAGASRGDEDGILVGGRGRVPMRDICVRGSEEELALLPVVATFFWGFEVILPFLDCSFLNFNCTELVILHGLNEHSGRYSRFATQLNACDFGVYAMDWIGHGGSDGLHGYVPSLDYVVEDTVKFLKKIKHEHEGVPCLLFGHSTGGAIVLKAACFPHIETMVEGVIMTSPALRVTPSHPIAVAPLISLVLPKLQFKGASKPGIAVSRDPAALSAKYSDPLVYTGPIRVRTGHEILRLSSYLLKKMKSITVPFLVMHGTADRVTDPLASMDLYNVAASKRKDIRLYEGLLHDLLFEPERDEVVADIINWIKRRLEQKSDEVNESMEKAI